ncbi:MAG TPA: ATP-binding cassette domain-containing protein [Spirochaetota bacterium]|nr:ATP-binding cassette domain-containing protein [Spirochaetota bacterium]
MISVRELTRHYGDLVAVNNLTFTIRKGEITGLLGPNGAGKTTTLRMLTCYLTPTSGIVSIGDFRVDEDPIAVREIIGYLPESVPIYGDMVVYDYLKYVADIRGVTDPGRIREIAELCGISEIMHKNVEELSKGYRQRVGLAHAMIHDPEILILDEPTSGLDPNQIVEIRNLIREIGKTKTIILSTHILSEVEATCDRVIIINEGRIVKDSTVDAITSSHGSEIVIHATIGGADFPSIEAAIRKLDGVAHVSQTGGEGDLVTVEVQTNAASDLRPMIFHTAAENGWVLYEMARDAMTLERIFRDLTIGGGA